MYNADRNEPIVRPSIGRASLQSLLICLLVWMVSFLTPSHAEVPVLASMTVQDSCSFLCNPDFEDKEFVKPGQFTFVHQSDFPCWKTTASDQYIEIWGDGFGGVPAFSGKYFVELNANMVSTLYQDFKAVPGSTALVSFAHRGRAGTDVMNVELGPVGGPFVVLGTFSAGNKAWEYHKIPFSFPVNKGTDYSLRFTSVSAAGGATVGNFLDAITIELPRPVLTLDIVQPSCTKSNDGSITLTAKEGSAPYTFYWSVPGVGDVTSAGNLGPGTYAVTVADFYGCRSIDTATLLPQGDAIFISMTESICQGDSMPWDGAFVQDSGLYADTLSTVLGCDSIVTLLLEVIPPSMSLTQATACGSYLWHGMVLQQSGTYSFPATSASGCDSTAYLELTIDLPTEKRDTVAACRSYTWPITGQTYTSSDVYEVVLTNEKGCDSLVYLHLTLYPDHRDTVKVSSCSSYQWTVTGVNYTEGGDYPVLLTNSYGCDSLVVLRLDILQPTSAEVFASACRQYTWPLNGYTYTTSGSFLQKLTNAAGCDSTVVLELTIHPVTTTTDTVIVYGSYTWPITGKTYLESGTYLRGLQDTRGCDSILVLILEVLPKGGLYIPTAFSPDGDGINDRFTIHAHPFVRLLHHVTVYDRWGNCLFHREVMEPNDLEAGWDGTYRGALMDPAVFVYHLQAEMADGSREAVKGEIHLVR